MNKDEERVVRCIGAICEMSKVACRMKPLDARGAIEFLSSLWEGWEKHRDFEQHYKSTRYRRAFDLDITNPEAVAVFEHEVGIRGRGDPYGHESYIFASLSELCSPRMIEKYTRMLGTFAEIIPMWEDCPYHDTRIVVWSRSPKGAGNAMECRMELKRILKKVCPRLSPYASKIRTAYRKPKHVYLGAYHKEPGLGSENYQERYNTWLIEMREMRRKPSLQPAEYREMRKGQLWLEWRCPPDIRALMGQVMVSGDPHDFWLVASGQVKSVDVEGMMVHQLSLFDSDESLDNRQ